MLALRRFNERRLWFSEMRDTALFVVLINEKVNSLDPARRTAASILLDAIQVDAFDRRKRLRLEEVIGDASPEVLRELRAMAESYRL
jgi:hypothetical protein